MDYELHNDYSKKSWRERNPENVLTIQAEKEDDEQDVEHCSESQNGADGVVEQPSAEDHDLVIWSIRGKKGGKG